MTHIWLPVMAIASTEKKNYPVVLEGKLVSRRTVLIGVPYRYNGIGIFGGMGDAFFSVDCLPIFRKIWEI